MLASCELFRMRNLVCSCLSSREGSRSQRNLWWRCKEATTTLPRRIFYPNEPLRLCVLLLCVLLDGRVRSLPRSSVYSLIV